MPPAAPPSARCAAVLRLLGVVLAALFAAVPVAARPLSPAARSQIARHEPTRVIVELDSSAVTQAAARERARRGLRFDDRAILSDSARAFAAAKALAEAAFAGPGIVAVRDLPHLPLLVLTLDSGDALERIEATRGVRRVHEDVRLRPVSVSDLAFISEPQGAQAGYTGAGTTVAVIDGGLAANYDTFSDFGSCNGTTLGGGCRVVVNDVFYTGSKASSETAHGTNVAAIALGVAPGTNLAMFNVFEGASAASSDIVTAMDDVLADRQGANQYNYVAVNLSLGDGTSNATQCGSSVFESAIANLATAGVTTVAAAGNSSSKQGLGDPACAPGAVSVGAVYNASYGGLSWKLTSTTTCSDSTTAPDQVACFSQSAPYLTLLAPGALVSAPNTSTTYTLGGTSQATPHVAGSIAVLRAAYPSESLAETVLRLTSTGVADYDPAAGRTTPRISLYAAATLGAALSLTGAGPATVTANQPAAYTLSATNAGPIAATAVVITSSVPAGASYVAGSPGCALSGTTVACSLGTLAANSGASVTIDYAFASSGPAFVTASLSLAEQNSTPGAGSVGIGTAPPSAPVSGDGPLPPWAVVLLAAALAAISARRLRDAA